MNNPYVYRDRKMMKWIPFNALMEQSEYISDLLHGRTRIEKPLLSPDQYDELNYNLEMAITFQSAVLIDYFENGEILQIDGIITRVDSYQKAIYLEEVELSIHAITKITLL